MNDPDSSRVEDLCHSGAFGWVCHSRQGEPRGLLALPRVRCARRRSEARCQRFSCQRSRTLSPSDGEKSLEHRFSFVGLIHLILVLWTVKSFFPKFGFEIPAWNRRGDSQLPRWFVLPTPFVASTVGKGHTCPPALHPEFLTRAAVNRIHSWSCQRRPAHCSVEWVARPWRCIGSAITNCYLVLPHRQVDVTQQNIKCDVEF